MSSVCGGGQTNRNSACGGCGFIPKSVTRQACEGGGKMAGRLPVRRTEMRGGRWMRNESNVVGFVEMHHQPTVAFCERFE